MFLDISSSITAFSYSFSLFSFFLQALVGVWFTQNYWGQFFSLICFSFFLAQNSADLIFFFFFFAMPICGIMQPDCLDRDSDRRVRRVGDRVA